MHEIEVNPAPEPIGVMIDAAAPPEGAVYGEPAVVIGGMKLCTLCGNQHEHEVCPRCGSDIISGFGLAGGPGFGPWKCCEKECGWTWKRALPDDED